MGRRRQERRPPICIQCQRQPCRLCHRRVPNDTPHTIQPTATTQLYIHILTLPTPALTTTQSPASNSPSESSMTNATKAPSGTLSSAPTSSAMTQRTKSSHLTTTTRLSTGCIITVNGATCSSPTTTRIRSSCLDSGNIRLDRTGRRLNRWIVRTFVLLIRVGLGRL